MQRIQLKTTSPGLTKERRRLARMGLQLAELVDDFVESTAEYHPSFLQDLDQSMQEIASGKGRRLTSLKDLA